MISLLRHLKTAIKRLIRLPIMSLSTIAVTALLLLVSCILALWGFAISSGVEAVNQKITIIINFNSGVTERSTPVIDLTRELLALSGGITTLYTSSSEALTRMRQRDPRLADILTIEGGNPFPNALEIAEIPLDRYSQIDAIVSQFSGAIDYSASQAGFSLDYRSQYDRIARLVEGAQQLLTATLYLAGFLLLTLLTILYFVILSLVQHAREELSIMRLVGGNWAAIHFPIALQASILVILAEIVMLLVMSAAVQIFTLSFGSSFTVFITGFITAYGSFLLIGCLLLPLIAAGMWLFCARRALHSPLHRG